MMYYVNVNIALALVYGFYYLVLRRSVYFYANRAFLLSGLALAFIIPALNLNLEGLSGILASFYTTEAFPESIGLAPAIGVTSIPPDPVSISIAQSATTLTLKKWVFIIYGCISGLLLLKSLIFLVQLLKLYRKNRVLKQPGYRLVLLENKKTPAFSFFSIVFMNSEDLERRDNWILRHELVHVKHLHSLDLVLSELVKTLLWINPFAYLYQRALRSVNEYAADAIVSRDKKGRYARLIYNYSFRSPTHSLQNSFYNKNLLKRRIIMLYRKKTWKMKAAYLLVLPLMGLLLAFNLRTTEGPHYSGPQTPTSNVTPTTSQTITVTGTVKDIMDQGIAGASIFVQGTPNGTATDLEGHFKLRNVPVDAQLQFSMIGYETELVTLQNNSTVNIHLRRKRERLEILNLATYRAKGEEPEIAEITNPEPSPKHEGPVYQFASIEKMPSFPGGQEMLIKHISKRYRYPTKARNNNVEGTIEIGFIVDEEGNVTQPEIIKGIGSGCDEEALRVVKTLPRWEPGQQNGVNVAVYYIVPLNLSVE